MVNESSSAVIEASDYWEQVENWGGGGPAQSVQSQLCHQSKLIPDVQIIYLPAD